MLQISKGETARAEILAASGAKAAAEAKLKVLEAELEQLKKGSSKSSSELKIKVGPCILACG